MLRDWIKTEEYFEKYISYQKERIRKFTEALSQSDEKDSSRIIQCNMFLANYYKDLFVAEYSYGAMQEELTSIFLKYTEVLKVAGIRSYSDMVDLLSIGILLDCQIDKDWLSEVKQFDDALTINLKRVLNKENVREHSDSGELKYPKYYKIFLDYLYNKITLPQLEDYVLNEWYKESSELSWYDSHLSKENVFVGYWCWVAAAVVKGKGETVGVSKYIPNLSDIGNVK